VVIGSILLKIFNVFSPVLANLEFRINLSKCFASQVLPNGFADPSKINWAALNYGKLLKYIYVGS